MKPLCVWVWIGTELHSRSALALTSHLPFLQDTNMCSWYAENVADKALVTAAGQEHIVSGASKYVWGLWLQPDGHLHTLSLIHI